MTELLSAFGQYQQPLSAEIENIHRNLNLTGNANVTTVAADATLSPLHAGLVEVDTSAGAVTLTLPTAVGNLGLTYIFKITVAGNSLTLDASGAELIDGATTLVVRQLYRTIEIRSDNSAWQVMSGLDNNPAGAILPFGGTAAPTGYLLCDGSSKLRADYPALYAAIGTAFGTADGTHFNLPDFRGRFLRGVDHAQARDPDRATRSAMNAGGNTGDNVGSIQDHQFDEHTHVQDEHNHTQNQHRHNSLAENYKAYLCNVTKSAGSADAIFNGTGQYTSYTTPTNVATTATNQNTGGNETRPINAFVEYIIRY